MIILALVLFISCVFAIPVAFVSTPLNLYTIVIDAGHGGIDGGSVGVNTGKDENYINLQYALTLQGIFEKYNIKIVMTRTNLNGLYNNFSDNKKLDDMEKRKKIIDQSNADLVISIHMNSFPLSSCKGAQVFFSNNNEPSQKLATCIQEIFIYTLPNARQEALVGDYYLLNNFKIPSVIVECGYLSNPEEELQLLKSEYKELVCYSIFIGVLKFLAV
ncbi:MAG: N-acetylmuramoyl-L-alanine amidase [Clostridia bacterium]|nr:N-acetylmuramoyl-L-alanine amidase [Clostridia bacterium]